MIVVVLVSILLLAPLALVQTAATAACRVNKLKFTSGGALVLV